jgi:hypothetical protein
VNAALTPQQQADLKRVEFSMEVKAFLAGKIGTYLTERAQHEVEAFTQALKEHDILANPVGAKNLQMEIKCAENFLYWLAGAVNEGTEVMKQLLAEERQALGRDDGAQLGDPTGS